MSSSYRLPRSAVARFIAIVGALALAIALVPAFPAHAQRDIDNACPAGADVDDPGFTDQDALSPENAEIIACLFTYGITEGQTATTYGTQNPVNRAQLATFVVRLLEETGFDLPAASDEDVFTDTDSIPAVHRDNVLILHALGVLEGYEDGTFRPTVGVNRAQAASYLARAQVEINAEFDVDDDEFSDLQEHDSDFDDIAGNTHQDNIELLASLGVIAGYPDGDYRPELVLARGQMASLLMRHIDVLVVLGLIDPLSTDNQTISVTPDDAAQLEFDDLRQYTASGLDTDETYVIVLANGDNVDVGDDGVVTFEEDDGDADFDDISIESVIAVVNGDATDDEQVEEAVEPQADGTIDFTVETAETFEELVPVVFVESGDLDDLAVDEDGAPTEDFGIGGAISVLPDEADDGHPDANATILHIDRDADFIVADDGGTERTFFYDDNDDFFDDAAGGAANSLTYDEFEEMVTEDDELFLESEYQDNPALASDFRLNNLFPEAPTLAEEETGNDFVELTVGNVDEDDDPIVRIYAIEDDDPADDGGGAGSEDFDDADIVAESDEDEDDDTADWQITVDGLDDETDYEFWATQEVDGEESDESDVLQLTTTSDPGDLSITDVGANELNDGEGMTDEIRIEFNEDATLDPDAGTAAAINAGEIVVFPTNQPSFEIDATVIVSGDTEDEWVVQLDTTLNDADDDNEYTVEIDAGALVDDDGDPNASLEGTFNY